MKYLFILIAFVAGALTGCAKKKESSKSAPTRSSPSAQSTDATLTPKDTTLTQKTRSFPGVLAEAERTHKQARIKLASGGEIVFEIFGDEAPKAASNFIALAKDTFYAGLTFHRVEPGFVVQGGDPQGNGTGGPGYQFDDEPVTRDYTQGIVAMANSGPNTNGSQFFILLEDTPLPKQYTIFGMVTSGFEQVKTIKKGDQMQTVTIEDSQ